MPDSVYQVIELIGSSSDSWELAAQNAVREAAKVYDDLRVAEVAISVKYATSGSSTAGDAAAARNSGPRIDPEIGPEIEPEIEPEIGPKIGQGAASG